jgi:hypothetical protein
MDEKASCNWLHGHAQSCNQEAISCAISDNVIRYSCNMNRVPQYFPQVDLLRNNTYYPGILGGADVVSRNIAVRLRTAAAMVVVAAVAWGALGSPGLAQTSEPLPAEATPPEVKTAPEVAGPSESNVSSKAKKRRHRHSHWHGHRHWHNPWFPWARWFSWFPLRF